MIAGDWSHGIDPDIPSAARMYDYFLGGNHNFDADRQAAERVIAAMPNVRTMARANRAFLGRAVNYMLARGVRQFLDIGSGIPTAGNVHELATQTDPPARVVYVDVDPVAVAHSINLLRGKPYATAIRADLRYPEAILTHHNVRTLLDMTKPVGLLMVSMLHFVTDEQAYPAVAHLRDVLAPGSYLALSHVAIEALTPDLTDAVGQVYSTTTTPTGTMRNRAQIGAFMDGMTVVDPGLVWVSEWNPDNPQAVETDPDIAILAAVAHKP